MCCSVTTKQYVPVKPTPTLSSTENNNYYKCLDSDDDDDITVVTSNKSSSRSQAPIIPQHSPFQSRTDTFKSNGSATVVRISLIDRIWVSAENGFPILGSSIFEMTMHGRQSIARHPQST